MIPHENACLVLNLGKLSSVLHLLNKYRMLRIEWPTVMATNVSKVDGVCLWISQVGSIT